MNVPRFLQGLSGDRQFLLVIILGNLLWAVIPMALLLPFIIMWWFI
jgi:hypothetical protein